MTKHINPRIEWTPDELSLLVPHARAIFHGTSYQSRLRQIVLPGRTPQAIRARLVILVGCMKARAGEANISAVRAPKGTAAAMARGVVAEKD